MDKKSILELGNHTHNTIIQFCEFYKNENVSETSFSDWSAGDVIAHINSWIKFSKDKLEAFKKNYPFKDIDESDIEKINISFYEKYKNTALDIILNETKTLFEDYGRVLDLFEEKDLLSDEFPTGFSCALWEYMVLDLFLHPIQHIFYYHVKRGNYNEFIKTAESCKKYSKNNMKIYDFSHLFEQKEEKEKHFNKLKDIAKNTDNKFLEEIMTNLAAECAPSY